MKNILLLSSLFLCTVAFGQIKTPSASPSCTVNQAFGLGEITIEYSRPSIKERKIFGVDGLVKFDQKWRLGANAVTKITFSDDVTINGEALASGSYAALATPSATKWDLHLYPYGERSWSSYKDQEPTATVSSPVKKLPFSVESFMIIVDDLRDNTATLDFIWDNVNVEFALVTEVDSKVMDAIETVMNGPSNNDYYRAATYYHGNGKDLNKALEWVQKATSGDSPRFWQVRRKALILADLGKVTDAIAAAKQSMELAEAAGNMEYVEMNKKSIMEWSK